MSTGTALGFGSSSVGRTVAEGGGGQDTHKVEGRGAGDGGISRQRLRPASFELRQETRAHSCRLQASWAWTPARAVGTAAHRPAGSGGAAVASLSEGKTFYVEAARGARGSSDTGGGLGPGGASRRGGREGAGIWEGGGGMEGRGGGRWRAR